MTIRAFLSMVTERDSAGNIVPQHLRMKIASGLTQPAIHCISQECLEDDGNNSLVMLSETIRFFSDVLIQVIRDHTGNIPPREYAEELIRQLNRDGVSIQSRFPCLFQTEKSELTPIWQCLTYTQWEAWIAKFYDKNVVVFKYCEIEQSYQPKANSHCWAEFLRLADTYFKLHSSHDSMTSMLLAMHRVLLSITTAHELPKHELWQSPIRMQFDSIANRRVELNLFERIISPRSDKRILFLSGESNLGKTTLLSAYLRQCDASQSIRSTKADCKGGIPFANLLHKLVLDLRNDVRNLNKPPIERQEIVEDRFLRDLHSLMQKQLPVVIFLDTYEDATHQCTQWIEETLLPFICNNEHVALVIAGQRIPTMSKFWSEKTLQHELKPIRVPKEWCAFRDRNRITNLTDEQIQDFVAVADGDPGFLGPVILKNKNGTLI